MTRLIPITTAPRLGILAALMLALLALTACASQTRRQSAADAIAGVDALESVAAPEAAQIAGQVAAGTKGHIAATAGAKQTDLPAPTQTPDQIIAAPDQYRQSGEDAEAAAAAGFWKQVAGWGGAALLTVLGVLKFVPGAHTPVVGLLQRLLENRLDRTARERQEGLAQAAPIMIRAIEQYGPDSVKAAIARKVPGRAKEAIDAYLDEMGQITRAPTTPTPASTTPTEPTP